MKKLGRGVTVTEALSAARAAGCVTEECSGGETYLMHSESRTSFTLRRQSQHDRGLAPLALIRFVNKVIG